MQMNDKVAAKNKKDEKDIMSLIGRSISPVPPQIRHAIAIGGDIPDWHDSKKKGAIEDSKKKASSNDDYEWNLSDETNIHHAMVQKHSPTIEEDIDMELIDQLMDIDDSYNPPTVQEAQMHIYSSTDIKKPIPRRKKF